MNSKVPLDVDMLRSVLDSMNLGLYVTDRDRRILLWNRKAEGITGHQASDVVGKACHENILVHVDKDNHQLCHGELCPLNRSMLLDMESQTPIIVYARKADGQRVAVSVSTAPMHDSSKQVIGGIETFSDSTAQIRNLEFAKQIQRHLLPTTHELHQNIRFDVRYYPHELVGGDFYDFHEVAPGKYGILIADVVGHGVSAALYTMWLKSLSESLKRYSPNPHEFLAAMNRELCRFVVDEGFATAFYAVIDVESYELTYANAGNPRPFLYRANSNELTKLDLHGFPLGIQVESAYDSSMTILQPGDLLICYTDGATEVVDRQDRMLDEDGLEAVLKRQISSRDKDLLERIYLFIKDSCGSVTLPDDVTLISLERIG